MPEIDKRYSIGETGLDKIKIPPLAQFQSGMKNLLFKLKSSISEEILTRDLASGVKITISYPIIEIKGTNQEMSDLDVKVSPRISKDWVPMICPELKPDFHFRINSLDIEGQGEIPYDFKKFNVTYKEKTHSTRQQTKYGTFTLIH